MTEDDQDQQPAAMGAEGRVCRMLAGLLTIPCIQFGFLLLLQAVQYLGDFDFERLWHCVVFALTLIAPFLALVGYRHYLRQRTWRSWGLSLAGAALVVVVWLLWGAPLSGGPFPNSTRSTKASAL